ncbi:hypothetical protein [Niallia taxi]|uniref:hypothetical protein n=1 Tax=Niallia taxi TaxID=2499688 RepID=UPI003009F087
MRTIDFGIFSQGKNETINLDIPHLLTDKCLVDVLRFTIQNLEDSIESTEALNHLDTLEDHIEELAARFREYKRAIPNLVDDNELLKHKNVVKLDLR